MGPVWFEAGRLLGENDDNQPPQPVDWAEATMTAWDYGMIAVAIALVILATIAGYRLFKQIAQ